MSHSRYHVVLGAPLEEKLSFQTIASGSNQFIGVDRGALHLLEQIQQVDLAVGDFDSLDDYERKRVETNSKKIINFSSDKDDTDTELALDILLNDYQAQEVYVYNWSGGRLDHLWSLLYLAHQERFRTNINRLVFTSKHNQFSFYKPGAYHVKQTLKNSYVSIIGLEPLKNLTVQNAQYTLNQVDYSTPIALISNEFIKDSLYCSFDEGIIAIVQSTDEN